MNDQFSAFLDGEASRDEVDSVINAMLSDEELRESWSRQHWLRTTLRAYSGEIAVALDPEFSGRVMRAIAADDQAETIATAGVTSVERHRAPRRRRWRNMAGLAAVASATGFVLLVSNPLQRESASDMSAPPAHAAAVDAASAAASGTQVVASNQLSGDMLDHTRMQQAAIQSGPADHWSVSDPALEDELNGYLVEHNGLSRGYGLSGTTPAFVRVATYGRETAQ